MRISRVLSRWKIPLLALLALLALGSYLAFAQGRNAHAALTVHRADVGQQVRISGSVIPAKDANLGFAASGRIKGVYASVGQHVEAGAILAEVENGDEIAEVAKQRANLETLILGTRPEEIAAAETAVEGAQAALIEDIRSAYVAADDAVENRADVIFENPGSTPRLKFPHYVGLKDTLEKERATLIDLLPEWQKALTTLTPGTAKDAAKTAEANLAYVRTFLDNANTAINQAIPDQTTTTTVLAGYASSVAIGRTNVANATTKLIADENALAAAEKELALKRAGSTEGDIAEGRATLANAQAALAKTRIVAPFRGTVTKMDAKAGEIVSPSTSEIAIQSDGVYEVEVYIPEVSIAGVAVGNPATTTLDAYGSETFFGARVIMVDPAETMKNGVPTYKTTLIFLDADSRIRSGMTADVVITTGTLEDAIVLPVGAVGHDASGAFVTVLLGKERERRSVTTGSTPSLGQVEITAGLSDGETVSLAP
jgi:RND family efflux transporter MFP subunit